jgi:hypothetical protein
LECSQNRRRKQANDMEWGKLKLQVRELRGEKKGIAGGLVLKMESSGLTRE